MKQELQLQIVISRSEFTACYHKRSYIVNLITHLCYQSLLFKFKFPIKSNLLRIRVKIQVHVLRFTNRGQHGMVIDHITNINHGNVLNINNK